MSPDPPERTPRTGAHVASLRESMFDDARPEAVAKAHSKGKLTTRERLDILCDEGSLSEYGLFATDPELEVGATPADGIVVGTATVEGRPVALAAHDFTVAGGSDGMLGIEKLARIGDIALRHGLPMIMLLEGGGHRITDGLDSRSFGKGGVAFFEYQARLSGWSPMVCAIMGPGFAGPANYSAFADYVPMVEGISAMGIAGPALVKGALGEDLDKEQLGGTSVQVDRNGMADRAFPDDASLLESIKDFLSYLPTNASEPPPSTGRRSDHGLDLEMREIVPEDRALAYDVRRVIAKVVDDGDMFELKPTFAPNIVTAFAWVDGQAVGVLANQPLHLAGTIDANAAEKASRFLTVCSAFGLPMLSLCDTPGVLPGSESEAQGVVRKSAKILYALGHATAPLITIILRKAYGMGWVAMGGGRSFGSLSVMAWPTGEICAMGIEGAVDIALRDDWEDADDPAAARQALIDHFIELSNAQRASTGFAIDDLIDPADTRRRVIMALRGAGVPGVIGAMMPPKRHGIPPM